MCKITIYPSSSLVIYFRKSRAKSWAKHFLLILIQLQACFNRAASFSESSDRLLAAVVFSLTPVDISFI